MSPAAALRAEATAAGVLLRLSSDGRLKITGGGSLELLGRLRECHGELRALLQSEAAGVVDLRRRATNAATPAALRGPAEVTLRGEVRS